MASLSVKLASLAIKTISKPMANRLKNQAKQHESFKQFCIWIAQTMYNAEINMKTNLLGDPKPQRTRKLLEAKAIDTGANFISETFLFTVAGALILLENYRSRRKTANRRDAVDDKLASLADDLNEIREFMKDREEDRLAMEEVNHRVLHILSQMVDIAIKHGQANPSLRDEIRNLRYTDGFQDQNEFTAKEKKK